MKNRTRENHKALIFTQFISLYLLGCGGSQSQADLKIVGGTPVSPSEQEASSTVALVTPSGNSFCTGSLITPEHVVTAAHCLANYHEDNLYLAFGTVAKLGYFSRERLRSASTFKIHEEYDEGEMNLDPQSPPADIAIIKFDQSAPSNFKPIAIMTLDNNISEDEPLVLAGFGMTHWFFGSTGTLRKTETFVSAIDSLAKEFDFGPSQGRSACMGDSGGPAFVIRGQQLALLGITSRGSRFCNATGTYTDIRYYFEWLKDNL